MSRSRRRVTLGTLVTVVTDLSLRIKVAAMVYAKFCDYLSNEPCSVSGITVSRDSRHGTMEN